MMFRIIPFFLLIYLISCSSRNEDGRYIEISGKARFANNEYIYLERQVPDGFARIDSTQINSELAFTLKAPKGAEDIYRINFFGVQKVRLALGDEDIEVEADGINPNGFFSSRSPGAAQQRGSANIKIAKYRNRAEIIRQKIISAQMNKDSLQYFTFADSLAKLESEFRSLLKDIILKENGSLTALILMEDNFEIEPNIELYDEVMVQLRQNSGEHWKVKQLDEEYRSIKKVAIGSEAPDFILPDLTGEPIELSNFRGRYLFLDFWASWCQPCRMENPQYVKVYDRFKGDDFEILGVSFDKKKENWLKAIEEDGLEWRHVSDLKYFDSDLIQLYNITSVPTTFLLDPQGVIIAKNIHATELKKILEERF